ncbi:hypothetical protein H5410_062736 [Solanum commersonii]|uniref:Uncharacterized protein n=1 Tax=Solanum commersonii TaxID=4109 RepID=A0A9J5WBM7_SOLCO|nr:hypothetical protein H5410_062736 [Solanum commersonii]
MTHHIHSLQERIKFLLENTDQTMPPKSSPSHYKMDKTGVHSPTNVERASFDTRARVLSSSIESKEEILSSS